MGDKKIKVIIADDHPVFRQGMITILTRRSFTAAEAADGEEVLNLLKKEHYDVVLMDIRMKNMDGMKATRLVKRNHPKTKIIAFSMHDDLRIILDMMNEGADGYMIKSADPAEITEGIHAVCNGKNYFCKETSALMLDDYTKMKELQIAGANADKLLDPREKEIAFLLCQRLTNKEIGEAMNLSKRTIEYHRANIYEAYNVQNIVDLRYAVPGKIREDETLLKKFSKYLKWKTE